MTSIHQGSTPTLKRSFSTPTVHTMAQEATTTAVEKKRNKLGYHRTSIACTLGRKSFTRSHCRRRKIRCIVSSEIQNRCINCIRLKKDCSFCPVDQQPPVVDPQGNLTGPGNGGSTAHSQTSSLVLGPGNTSGTLSRSIFGRRSAQNTITLATPGLMPSIGYVSVPGEGLSMTNPDEQSFWGLPTEQSPVTLSGSMDMSYGWHSYGSECSSTEQASSFGLEAATQPTWMTATCETAQPNDWNWNSGVNPTAQARSLSFSNDLIGLPQQEFVSGSIIEVSRALSGSLNSSTFSINNKMDIVFNYWSVLKDRTPPENTTLGARNAHRKGVDRAMENVVEVDLQSPFCSLDATLE
ncbi:C6 finger domain protein, putative [Cordyceps militaris CM01]|uniref:C6 finger domain protein, putative n=1 Tax=Cordyceps militaris (strain CM01) TaxID=983644 RepID=G3JUE1_CORMM|nr:C6 finger domain protein, putative [Cordyceps militaris CM01]EGX87915.1 C6 finger domain protein, putative [Cordyceps militaris CM01]